MPLQESDTQTAAKVRWDKRTSRHGRCLCWLRAARGWETQAPKLFSSPLRRHT